MTLTVAEWVPTCAELEDWSEMRPLVGFTDSEATSSAEVASELIALVIL